MDTSYQNTWTIAADLHAVDRVCAEVTVCLQSFGLSGQNFAVQMLLREALNNAVIHGCDRNPAMQVRCELSIGAESLQISVEDDGPGFDWRSALQFEPISDDLESGRGLLVYKFYAEQIEFNASGSRICLVRDFNKTSSQGV